MKPIIFALLSVMCLSLPAQASYRIQAEGEVDFAFTPGGPLELNDQITVTFTTLDSLGTPTAFDDEETVWFYVNPGVGDRVFSDVQLSVNGTTNTGTFVSPPENLVNSLVPEALGINNRSFANLVAQVAAPANGTGLQFSGFDLLTVAIDGTLPSNAYIIQNSPTATLEESLLPGTYTFNDSTDTSSARFRDADDNTYYYEFDFHSIVIIPEPTSAILFLSAVGLLVARRKSSTF